MDSFLGKLTSPASETETNNPDARDIMLHEYLPRIITLLGARADPTICDIISDSQSLAGLARSTFQTLPLHLQETTKEQDFVDWIVLHQDKIVEQLECPRNLDRDTLSSSDASSPEREGEPISRDAD